MIWYIVTDIEENHKKSTGFFNHKLIFEKLTGDCCLILHYKQVNKELFLQNQPWAICHSGGSAMYDDYDILQTKEYCSCITDWDVPQIGFCGGHQIISTQFGSKIGPLRQLKDGEPDLNQWYCPGQLKEWGVYPVHIIKPDPIFEGLSEIIKVQEYHSWEVKELGSELILLASSENCKVQAFTHSKKPIYGTQFHPEQSSNNYPDGFRVLENFFKIAKNYRKNFH